MSSIFGRQTPGPTRINEVQINQSVLGFALPVVMGKGKVQQSLLWTDGFYANLINTGGGKGFGGGKNGNQYVYGADVIAALCAGAIIGIGDVWSGQSWLSNTIASETTTIVSGVPYVPTNASYLTADQGVGISTAYSGTYNDLGAPIPTALAGVHPVSMLRKPYGTTLAAGQYSVGPNGHYYFSPANAGQTVTLYYSFALATIKRQQHDLIPSGRTVAVGGTLPFSADGGVVYDYTDGTHSNNGVALTRVSGTPTATGTYSVSGSGPATYTFAPGDVDAEVNITFVLNNSAALPAGTSASLAFTLFEGYQAQSPWALVATNFPGAALGYTGMAYVAYGPMDLGYGAQIQQNVFEVLTGDGWGAGIADCNAVQCILQVLTNTVWGLGAGAVPFPTNAIDNTVAGSWGNPLATGAPRQDSTAATWFAANGFFISPVVDKQDTAASLMGRWLDAGQCAAFMSEGLFKLVPYGDTSTAGNGCVWVAPSAFAAALDDTDFIAKEGEEPVQISSTPWQDAYNTVQVGWKNRANQYGPEITPESDQAAINRYGSRIEDPQTWDFITTLPAAIFAASMRVKRNVYTRNSYAFQLPYRFTYLEPMDVVYITTSSAWAATANNTLGIVNRPVRITKVVDNPDGTLDVVAEDYPFGVHAPSRYNKALAAGTVQPNLFADPGDTEAVIFEAPDRLTGYAGDQIWIGATGANKAWGGCTVLASMDGTKYQPIGDIGVPARLGVLAADLPTCTATDPTTDPTSSLIANLVTGSNALESATDADADQDNTLCYVDGELISYAAATCTGVDQYTATGYLRRGQMGTTIAAHTAGAQFLRLDSSVFKYTYDPSWYGKTIYLKFQSKNVYGNSAQDPSTLTAITFTVPGLNPGAFSSATGTVQKPVPVSVGSLLQPLVDSGAVAPGTYGGHTVGIGTPPPGGYYGL